MDIRYQVFVSSTYADLKDERQKVIQTLMSMDCIPAGMELFPAVDQEQFEFIKRVINDCDYYLLIIGGRYGSLTKQGISYTEQEYEYALERGLKVIALIHNNPDQLPLSKSEKDPELRTLLKNFSDKVSTGRLVNFWEESRELPGIVAISLMSTIKTYPAIGWLRADKASNEELLNEINELRKKNELLNKTLSEVEPSIFTGSEEKDFSYINKQLNRSVDVIIQRDEDIINNKFTKTISFNLSTLIPLLNKENQYTYSFHVVDEIIYKNYPDSDPDDNITSEDISDLSAELLMYGFLEKVNIPPVNDTREYAGIFSREEYKLVYSKKFERYKYWLNVNDKMPKEIKFDEV